MKRVITVGLLLLMLLSISFAETADTVDLTKMELDELADLSNKVKAELISRTGEDGDVAGAGRYYTGVDIKPGSYDFILTDVLDVNGVKLFYATVFEILENGRDNIL